MFEVKKVRTGEKRRRKDKGDPADLDGYMGPWREYEDEVCNNNGCFLFYYTWKCDLYIKITCHFSFIIQLELLFVGVIVNPRYSMYKNSENVCVFTGEAVIVALNVGVQVNSKVMVALMCVCVCVCR